MLAGAIYIVVVVAIGLAFQFLIPGGEVSLQLCPFCNQRVAEQ